MNYLDYTGLTKVWDEMNPHVIFYGVCETASTTQQKEVVVNGLSKIDEGTHVIVKFVNPNTHGEPTLHVVSNACSNVAAAQIVDEDGKTISDVMAGCIKNYCEFVRDGDGYWVLVSSQFGNQVIYTDTSAEPPGEEGMIWLKKKPTT